MEPGKYQLLVDAESIIECPICNELLCPPLYQCKNGHIVCATCCEKLTQKRCAYCRSKPIAHSRCLVLEKLIESLVTSCRYAPQGCQEMLKLAQKEQHEIELCKHRPHIQSPDKDPTTTVKFTTKKLAQEMPQQQHEHLQEINQPHLRQEEQFQEEDVYLDLGLQDQSQHSRMSAGPASLSVMWQLLLPHFSTPQQFDHLCSLYEMCQERDFMWEQFYHETISIFWDECQLETILQILQSMEHLYDD